jgi:hypothetical protein
MKTKNFTLIFFVIMLVSVSRSNSQNILTDGDFSTTTIITPYTEGVAPANLWCTFQNAGIEATATVDAGVCSYQVVYGGYNTWEVQLVQWGFSLTPGNYYRLTFDVRADAERWFGVYLGEDGGNWTSILGYYNYYQYASTDWRTITVDFNAANVFPYHKFSFEIGGFNTGMYFDNIMLVDLGPNPSVGILGTAVSGWDTDVDMVTSDGITYTLTDYPLSFGELKFRQNNAWSINWGGTDFPTGVAYQDGPNIPVFSPGNYEITFNRITGEYSFVCTSNCLPAVGIGGPAVPPYFSWDNDVKMRTSDGVEYSLPGFTFTDGEAKFRQDNNPDASWGGTGFPSGTATLGGPGIPVIAGSYTVTFNLSTGEYSFVFPSVGIIGSSLTGWAEDIDMQTTDGLIYTLSEYAFTEGEVKFRQDNEWAVNWGGWDFPAGYGYPDGPNIYVPAGTYNITFNRPTGEYLFAATACPVPGLTCPYYVYEGNSPGLCGAFVFYPDVVPAPNCGGEGITITQTAGLASGSFFPLGVTTNNYVITNASGASSTCSFDVYVFNTEPLVIENLTVSPETIWPPDHKMVPATIDYTVTDNCGGATYSQLWVWSNESDDWSGDGKTVSDYEVLDEHHVLLRAERSGTGTGREYYITVYVYGETGSYAIQQVVVTVPHDMSSGTPELTVKSAGIPDDDAGMELTVKIWPNPGESHFNLDVVSSSDEIIELYIHDMSGRLISVINVTDKGSFRFGDNLQSGIYMATVRQGAFSKTVSIVKLF